MSLNSRAAQFAPFAALSGYDDMVRETRRETENRIELSEEGQAELDRKLAILQECLISGKKTEAVISFFVPDSRKSGGHYEQYSAQVKMIDSAQRKIIFYADNGISAGREISIEMISDIQLPPNLLSDIRVPE